MHYGVRTHWFMSISKDQCVHMVYARTNSRKAHASFAFFFSETLKNWVFIFETYKKTYVNFNCFLKPGPNILKSMRILIWSLLVLDQPFSNHKINIDSIIIRPYYLKTLYLTVYVSIMLISFNINFILMLILHSVCLNWFLLLSFQLFMSNTY